MGLLLAEQDDSEGRSSPHFDDLEDIVLLCCGCLFFLATKCWQ